METVFSHDQENWQTGQFGLIYSFFSTFYPILSLEMSGDLSQAKFISPVRQFCEKDKSFMVIQAKTAKSRYFFPPQMFTFHSLVQFLLPMVKLNGVSQSISIEYKMVHGLIQAVFTT